MIPKKEGEVPAPHTFNVNNLDIDVSLEEENHCINYWKKMVQLRSQTGPVKTINKGLPRI